MRAVRIEAFGEPADVLEHVEIPEPPPPAAGEVLIGVEHAPINMNDLYLIQGAFPIRPLLPSVAGNEGVGRVLALGAGVEHLKIGDHVLIPLYSFSWRERLVVSAARLFALPHGDLRQLAMAGINPPTAALLLSQFVDLKPGDWVAQNASNSGVGRSLIAIARTRGLRTINFVRRAIKPRWLDALVTRRFNAAGFGVVPKRGSLDLILDRLAAGDVVVFPFDQHARPPDGIEVDFFGQPAWTFKSLAILALATGAPVLPASSWREPDGRHVLRFEAPVPPVDVANVNEAIARTTRAYNAAIERLVLRHPEQWWWVHRRWKSARRKRRQRTTRNLAALPDRNV